MHHGYLLQRLISNIAGAVKFNVPDTEWKKEILCQLLHCQSMLEKLKKIHRNRKVDGFWGRVLRLRMSSCLLNLLEQSILEFLEQSIQEQILAVVREKMSNLKF